MQKVEYILQHFSKDLMQKKFITKYMPCNLRNWSMEPSVQVYSIENK